MDEESLLGVETDKNGNSVEVRFCRYENMPIKLTAFFVRQWADLLEAGHCTENYVPRINNSRIIYAVCNDKIVGLRMWVWEHLDVRIILSAVDQSFRNQGILKIIIKYFDDRVISAGCNKTFTTIHANNDKMLEIAKKSGFEQHMIKMIKVYNNS